MPLKQLPVSEIEDPKTILRSHRDTDEMVQLLESIQAQGLLQPILVRKLDEGYRVVAGHRRLFACRELGFEEIPALVVEMTDQDESIARLTENLNREDLSPIDEAVEFGRLIREYDLTQMDLAKMVHKSIAYVNHRLRLLDLPGAIQTAVDTGILPVSTAYELCHAPNVDTMLHLAHFAVQDGCSPRQMKEWVGVERARAERAAQLEEPAPAPLQAPPAPMETVNCVPCGASAGVGVSLRPVLFCQNCFAHFMAGLGGEVEV